MTPHDLLTNADDEIERVAMNLRAEALGEARWIETAFQCGPRLARSIVLAALHRALAKMEA